MASSLQHFQGKPWSQIIVRPKINEGEVLLCDQIPCDLIKCRHCRVPLKCGYADIHQKKCEQHKANLPDSFKANSNSSSNKVVLAKHYYNISPIDNSSNPEVNNKKVNEPPSKKRKFNKTKSNEDDIDIILPPSMRNSKHNHSKKKKTQKHNIYNELFRGLAAYQQSSKLSSSKSSSSKRKTIKVKRLRLKRSSSKQNNNITPKGTSSTSSSNSTMPTTQSQTNGVTTDMMRNQNNNVNNNNNSNNSNNSNNKDGSLEIISAWDREQDRIEEEIQQTCNITYQKYENFWTSFVGATDRYAMEYASKGDTNKAKQLSQQIDRFLQLSNKSVRYAMDSMLSKAREYRYSVNGDGFQEYKRLDNLTRSYNIPHKSSNGIITPNAQFREWFDLYAYHMTYTKDQKEFAAEHQPTSGLKFFSKELHKRFIHTQKARQFQLELMRKSQNVQAKGKGNNAIHGSSNYPHRGPIPLNVHRNNNKNNGSMGQRQQSWQSSASSVKSNGHPAHPQTHPSHAQPQSHPPSHSRPHSSTAVPIPRNLMPNGYRMPGPQSRATNPIPMNPPHANGHNNSNGGRGRVLPPYNSNQPQQQRTPTNPMMNGHAVPPQRNRPPSTNSRSSYPNTRNGNHPTPTRPPSINGDAMSVASNPQTAIPTMPTPTRSYSNVSNATQSTHQSHQTHQSYNNSIPGRPSYNTQPPSSANGRRPTNPPSQIPGYPAQPAPVPFRRPNPNSQPNGSSYPRNPSQASSSAPNPNPNSNANPNPNPYPINNSNNNGRRRMPGPPQSQHPQRTNIRPPRYDPNGDAHSSHYNASPSDTQITTNTNVSNATYPNNNGTTTNNHQSQTSHMNGNNGHNVSPQSVNSNHTAYTSHSQTRGQPTPRSSTSIRSSSMRSAPMRYPPYNNHTTPPISQQQTQSNALPSPSSLQRQPTETKDHQMYMPSIGC